MTRPASLEYATLADLALWAEGIMALPPDYTIGEPTNPYMRRWFIVPRNPFANIYLHEILRSDDDRALHDHPWANQSVVIAGRYFEHLPDGSRLERLPGATVAREAEALHRLEIAPGERAVSLFITGPKVREWGFACPNGWRHWQDFTGGVNGEVVGCD